jgi:hypothetical protein
MIALVVVVDDVFVTVIVVGVVKASIHYTLPLLMMLLLL